MTELEIGLELLFKRRDLGRQLGVIAHPGQRLGEFEHVLLSEILHFNRSGHEQ